MLPTMQVADKGLLRIRLAVCILCPILDSGQQMMPKEDFKNKAELEVTFLEHFHSCKICISETASGRSVFKN